MSTRQFGNTRGFTIVEILVVIVVIGVLATITLVVFNGVQVRASNTAKTSTARTYINALSAYAALHNRYPTIPAGGSVCLGSGYPDGKCGGDDYPIEENAVFNEDLKDVIVSIPQATTKPTQKTYPSVTFTGVTLSYDTDFRVDGEVQPYYIQYVLEGFNKKCGNSNVVGIRPGGEWKDMVSNPSDQNTFYDPTSTTCVISLPN